MPRRIISEARVKVWIKSVLQKYRSDGIYYFMSVPNGYGTSTLDYLGFLYGHGFAIEAKRTDGKPTARQLGLISRIEAAGCPVFLIRDQDGVFKLDQWLEKIVAEYGNVRIGGPASHRGALGGDITHDRQQLLDDRRRGVRLRR
jgi:hypothetical protein